jgi:hypothetical protein
MESEAQGAVEELAFYPVSEGKVFAGLLSKGPDAAVQFSF